jgi:hypothetical protein
VTQYQAVFENQTNLSKTVNRKANMQEGRGESKLKRDKSYGVEKGTAASDQRAQNNESTNLPKSIPSA